jgi:hypothetical protein
MIPLREAGTDIWMACNAYTHQAKTGILENTRLSYLRILDLLGTDRYADKADLSAMLRTTVIGVIFAKRNAVIGDIARTFRFPKPEAFGSVGPVESVLPEAERPIRTTHKQELRDRCLQGNDPLLAYKARPLTGIWATAPYLHNGSVPTLYDLLLPPKDRPQRFLVGTREFDPERVGYVTRGPDGTLLEQSSGDNSFVFDTRDAGGRMIDGNSNAGHDYGNASFSPEERMALVEYMKGL